MNIKGLPEGLQASRFGVAEPEEFEIISNAGMDGGYILRKGQRIGSSTQIIVTPDTGYSFVKKYEIRQMEEQYVVAKTIDPPETITVEFTATNGYERECIAKTLENLKLVPGYVGQK